MNIEQSIKKVYEIAIKEVQNKLNILLEDFEKEYKYNPVEHIKYRIKDEKSAIEKLKRKGYVVTIDNLKLYIQDMIGIRIICPLLEDVQNIINFIRTSKYFIIKEERDYIKNPKKSGYQSYHIIIYVDVTINKKIQYVLAEIQIRTIAMDFWASINHKVQYKFKNIPPSVELEMLECSKYVQLLDKKMQILNENIKKYNNL